MWVKTLVPYPDSLLQWSQQAGVIARERKGYLGSCPTPAPWMGKILHHFEMMVLPHCLLVCTSGNRLQGFISVREADFAPIHSIWAWSFHLLKMVFPSFPLGTPFHWTYLYSWGRKERRPFLSTSDWAPGVPAFDGPESFGLAGRPPAYGDGMEEQAGGPGLLLPPGRMASKTPGARFRLGDTYLFLYRAICTHIRLKGPYSSSAALRNQKSGQNKATCRAGFTLGMNSDPLPATGMSLLGSPKLPQTKYPRTS